MKSGLEGRNNPFGHSGSLDAMNCLNEVRPRRPEQCVSEAHADHVHIVSMKSGLEGRNNVNEDKAERLVADVSMKSGLEGRNNSTQSTPTRRRCTSLNEVRPRRPEQSAAAPNRSGALKVSQ